MADLGSATEYTLGRGWRPFSEMVYAAQEGLDDTAMTRRPAENGGFIAWIFWYMNQVSDSETNFWEDAVSLVLDPL